MQKSKSDCRVECDCSCIENVPAGEIESFVASHQPGSAKAAGVAALPAWLMPLVLELLQKWLDSRKTKPAA